MNMTCTRVKQLPKQLEASNLKFGKQLEASTENWQNLELLIKKRVVYPSTNLAVDFWKFSAKNNDQN